jgi:ubiquinone/menaquinone biosynthesis C-methylase UbiE
VLNVGGADKAIPIPAHYHGWVHVLLDIQQGPGVDLVHDARRLTELQAAAFDAIYCSHNLEHYYPHEIPLVLAGFHHVLKSDGFAEIRVPDIAAVMRHAVEKDMELDEVLYESPAGPISIHDVIYGYGREIESSGEDYFAHKRGFTHKSLMAALQQAGFAAVWLTEADDSFDIGALAFKQQPSPEQRDALRLAG